MSQKEKLIIPYPVVVEGKYDKIRLSNIIETQIITTDGFGVFKAREKQMLLRRMAQNSPLILLTDSDGGGKVIRSHLSSMIPKNRLIQLYIPQIKGKERRKNTPSAEGTLGVEGMDDTLLYELFLPYASQDTPWAKAAQNPLSMADFLKMGLTGQDNSVARRDALCKHIGLPAGMSAKALLEALKLLYTYEEILLLMDNFFKS